MIFSLLGMPVTAYAVCIAAAAAMGIAALTVRCRQKGLKADTAGRIALLALPLGLLGARVFYCLARLSLYQEIGFAHMLYLWDGGYALWGALGGCALAGVIAARRSGQPLARVLDAMAAPGALTIALCRFAEYFSGAGIGEYVEDERFFHFPLAVMNEWEEWYWAVFVLEGVAALVIFLILLRSSRPAGDEARLFLILYSACQVLLESLRRDEFLRWLFVRVSQLTAVILLALLMLSAVARWARKPKNQRAPLQRLLGWWGLFLACVGGCIWMEFAVDKSPDLPVWVCYGIMALCCVGLGLAAGRVVLRKE